MFMRQGRVQLGGPFEEVITESLMPFHQSDTEQWTYHRRRKHFAERVVLYYSLLTLC